MFFLNYEACGRTEIVPSLRIVGGVLALPNSWPAHVALTINYKANNVYLNTTPVNLTVRYMCGGTLINPYTILTAGHCMLDKSFIYEYNNQSYLVDLTLNEFYPTFESMVSVFIGFSDISFIMNKTDSIKYGFNRTVSSIIKVIGFDLYSTSLLIVNKVFPASVV
jgi:hypothetical protein